MIKIGGHIMIEHKIGETFIFIDEDCQHHKLLTKGVHSEYTCEGCYLYENKIDCREQRYQYGPCHASLREDGRYVIFKEVKE